MALFVVLVAALFAAGALYVRTEAMPRALPNVGDVPARVTITITR